MQPQIIETKFCRLEVPYNWTLSPGLGGFHESSKRSAVVIENWLEEPTTASNYAKVQRQLYLANKPEIEFIEQKEFTSQELGDSQWSAFLALQDGYRVRQEQLTLVNGFLVCCLTLTARSEDTEAWSKTYPEIYRSFHISARDWAPQMRREPLVSVSTQKPRKEDLFSAPALQIAFPLPPRWSFDPETAQLRSVTGATISFRRAGLSSDDPSMLFADSLARRKGESGFQPRKWDKGENQSGYSFWALELTSSFKKTWGPAETLITQEAYFKDETALEIRLQAHESDIDARSVFSDIIETYTLLPAQERQLRVQDPWLDLTLAGPWMEAATGTYLRQSEPPSFLFTQQLADKNAISAAIKSFRSRPDVKTIVREEDVEGLWRGFDARRYFLDFLNQAPVPMSLRAAWLISGKIIYEIVVLGETGQETEALFLQSMNALKPL